ncbi:MOSC domain-containing protein [Pseudomonadota bacterium]
MAEIEITALSIYPVKSMKGIDLNEAVLTPEGLEHDRRFMVVRSDGRFVTQREWPVLALINTSLSNGCISLSRDGFGEVAIPSNRLQGDIVQTKVWGDHCETVDQGKEISRWLTAALESDDPLRLVRMKEGFRRPQNRAELLGESTTTFFADAAPFLVANEASLETLNEHLVAAGHQPVPMNRFRPNIVIRGLDAFAEHHLSRLDGGNYQLGFCHPCERCVVTTINQDTAEKEPGWQPFKTLRDLNPMPGKKPAPAFGHNAILLAGAQSAVQTGNTLTGHFS